MFEQSAAQRVKTARDMLTETIGRVNVTERRMIGLHSGILNATRNADRLLLANTIEALRLELSVIHELLRDTRGTLQTPTERTDD